VAKRAARVGDEKPVPTEDPFEVQIPSAKALAQYLEEKRRDVEGLVNNFWSSPNPSQLITQFMVGEGAPPIERIRSELDRTLTERFGSLDKLITDAFAPEFDFDVDEAFRRGIETEEKRSLFARELWLAGSPQAFFSSDGFALSANEFACLGLSTQGDRSAIEEALIATGRRPSVIPQLAPREAQLVRFAIGYPAFSFSPMAKMMPSRPDVTLEPDRFGSLVPLEPSLASRSDPEAFRIAVLARFGGILTGLDGTGLEFQGIVFDDLEAVLRDWDTGAGAVRKGQIEAQLRDLEKVQEPDGRSLLEVKLSQALETDLSLQGDEKRVVQNQLRLLQSERDLTSGT
jgi:hypothetical protein